jgi:hypothetical protein
MLEFSASNSSYVQYQLSTNLKIRPSRRNRFNPAPTESSRGEGQLYPYPIIRNGNRLLRMRDSSLTTIPSRINLWQRVGLKGVGVTTSVDMTIDARGEIQRILLGTRAGGLFLKGNGVGSAWTELPYPRSSAAAVQIDDNDSEHFLVAHQYNLGRDPGSVYQSCNSGQSWLDSGSLSLVDAGGVQRSIIVRDMELVGNSAVVLGQDADLQKIFILRANVGCRSVTRNGKTFREPIFNTVRRVLEVNSSVAPGYLKRNGNRLFVSIREGAGDSLYRSTNSGATWQTVVAAASGATHFISAYENVGARLVVAYLPQQSGVGKTLLKRSVDNGATFQAFEPSRLVMRWTNGRDQNRNLSQLPVDIQDIVLDADRPNFVGLFIYMMGYAESGNNGVALLQEIDQLEDVVYFPAADAAAGADDVAIVPLDVMRRVRTEKSAGWKSVLMPTDQGIFVYNQAADSLRNITDDLRLVESRGVAVTRCPRIYSGLWHVGSYWVGRDGAVKGFNGSESDGFGIDRTVADSCRQPAFNIQHGYLSDGRILDRQLSANIRASAFNTFADPFSRWPKLADGRLDYLYSWIRNVYNLSRQTGVLSSFQGGTDWIAHGAEDDSTPDRWYGLNSSYQLSWFTQAAGLNNIVDLDDGAGIDPAVAEGLDSEILVKGNTFVITGTKGTIISTDGGATFATVFAGKRVYAATVDRCGWIYVGVSPGVGVESGVFMSKDGGATFRRVGAGDSKSYVRDLEMDEGSRYLYAATYGESLLKIKVPAVGACG